MAKPMFEDNVTIKAFRAPEDPEVCAAFIFEHNRILEDFGITNVTTNNANWKSDPNVIVVAIHEEKLGLIGGMRIHCKYSPKSSLPIQDTLFIKEPTINNFVDELVSDGVGELCALWSASRFSGRELPYLLAISGIALMQQLNLKHCIGLVARHTLRYARSVGFQINESMGDNGVFDYPKPGFWGIVTHYDETSLLQNSNQLWRQRILSLRANPEQVYEECTARARLYSQYNLILNKSQNDPSRLPLRTLHKVSQPRTLMTTF